MACTLIPTATIENKSSNDLSLPQCAINNSTNDCIYTTSNQQQTLSLERRSPVIYHHLSFDTILPPPSTTSTIEGAIEQPDLTNYISPLKWSRVRKDFLIILACAATVFAGASAGEYAPAVEQIQVEFRIGRVTALVGLTTFTCGFAIAPMVLAPFSEINGRKPVFLASGTLLIICQLCTGVSRSFPGLLVARFFSGVGSSTFSTMVGGIVSDIYATHERNTPMTLFSCAALFGTGLGPFLSGFIAQKTTWRWIFYFHTIADAVIILIFCIFFQETRGSVLLSRKAKMLNNWYESREQAGYYGFEMPLLGDESKHVSQRIRWKVQSDEERSSLRKMILISLHRPFHMLLTEPVVFFFSLWAAFSWSILYLAFAAIPLVFQDKHNFSLEQANAVFAAMCVGALIATPLSIYQEKLANRYSMLPPTPENRLHFSCIESALMPAGLFMFGWTSASTIHWIVPTIAIGIATMGVFSIYLAVFNYLADTYHRYASSALAAQSFCRNMLGGIFPLVTDQMFRRLTYGGASSLLGGIGALLTLVPWVLVFYGVRIRARSRLASELVGKD